ncbi:MAG: putative TIM-barrel fold metal-dependent hydrolase [Alphaproteobacteria bacterium]|jgi:predicted TIM-barrel fold metal-dependent hydrolase
MPIDRTSIPIIDAHHHYWDPATNYHPWLRDEPPIPFRYGDYSSIRKPFLPADYKRLSKNLRIRATVTMEGEFDENDLVTESARMSQLASEQDAPAAHVARAILHKPDAPDIIRQHAAFPIVRGIRHKPAAASAPNTIEHANPGSMSDPAWQQGYAALQPNNLHFELQAPWWHVTELMQLIEKFPETPVVINHAFMPVDRSPDALKSWQDAISLAGTAPNVTIKISGIGVSGKPWTLADQRPIIDACIDTFGPKRCIFASNFPVDSLVGSFDDIYGGFLDATADLDQSDRYAMFHDNVIRIYRLDISQLNV